jgi:hypothetical protein
MKLKPEHYAIGAFILLTIASLWERRALPPAVFFLILAAALTRMKQRRDHGKHPIS